MRCPECNAEIVGEAIFCHQCGVKIEFDDRDDNSGRLTPVGQFKNKIESRQVDNDGKERELWEGTFSPKAMIGTWILSVFVSVGLIVSAVLMWNYTVTWVTIVAIALLWTYQLIVFARRRFGVLYRLTSQRFSHETGILRHKTDLIEVIDMDDIAFEQSLMDRLVGVGNIQIHSSDRTHPELWIRGIKNVKEVARVMHEARHAERLKRGLHIENI